MAFKIKVVAHPQLMTKERHIAEVNPKYFSSCASCIFAEFVRKQTEKIIERDKSIKVVVIDCIQEGYQPHDPNNPVIVGSVGFSKKRLGLMSETRRTLYSVVRYCPGLGKK